MDANVNLKNCFIRSIVEVKLLLNSHTYENYTQMVKALDEWRVAYLALGSNMHNKKQNLITAIESIKGCDGIRVVKQSHFLETKAEGFESENDFLNAVIEVETNLYPEILLQHLLLIESEMGRVRKDSGYEDRPIDLDILSYGEMIYNTKTLSIPHSEMHTRRFVLEPMCELNAQWRHPKLNKTAQELLSDCDQK